MDAYCLPYRIACCLRLFLVLVSHLASRISHKKAVVGWLWYRLKIADVEITSSQFEIATLPTIMITAKSWSRSRKNCWKRKIKKRFSKCTFPRELAPIYYYKIQTPVNLFENFPYALFWTVVRLSDETELNISQSRIFAWRLLNLNSSFKLTVILL